MDRIDSALHFPRLVYDGTVPLEHPNKKFGESRQAYRLEWPDNAEKPCLPDKMRKQVDGLIYIPSGEYIRSIRHYSMLAQAERLHRIQKADTVIRDRTLKVSQAAANTAFALLADCVYDADTNYYSRKPEDILIEHLLRYRFWLNHLYTTGRGLVHDHAGLDRLESYADVMNKSQGLSDNEEARRFAVCGFLNLIEVFEAAREPKVISSRVSGPYVPLDIAPFDDEPSDAACNPEPEEEIPGPVQHELWHNTVFPAKRIYNALGMELNEFKQLAADYGIVPYAYCFWNTKFNLNQINYLMGNKYSDPTALIEDLRQGHLHRDIAFQAPNNSDHSKPVDYSDVDWRRKYTLAEVYIAMGRPDWKAFERNLENQLGITIDNKWDETEAPRNDDSPEYVNLKLTCRAINILCCEPYHNPKALRVGLRGHTLPTFMVEGKPENTPS